MSQPQPIRSGSPSTRARPQRVRILACILCQQRKVKCDRKFPCANCLRFGKECTPATVTPRRRSRRFPERDLLDRIRKYETLLRKNHIEFQSLKSAAAADTTSLDSAPVESAESDDNSENEEEHGSIPATPKEAREGKHKLTISLARNLWHVLREQWKLQSSDQNGETIHDAVNQAGIRRAMDQVYVNNDHLLFGLRHMPVALSTLHPIPVQIFQLWQVYLNNVDPLLKVTHTPTLQGRIIEATSNLDNVTPALEALMFGIYAISVMSLTTEECQASFNSSRDEMLSKYQFACQQALLNSEYLRTNDRECLAAFYLFLLSIGPNTDPRSLSSMFGVAMRIAYRMGIHNNSTVVDCPPFEAEMHHRLWWALKLIDSRIGELSESKTVALDPIWDCKVPLNINDADLRPEMKDIPSAQSRTSDAIFVVVRCVLGDFIRHAEFHLDFTNPPLKSIAKGAQRGLVPENWSMVALEKLIEDRYLKHCNPDNPLHLMTLCMARIQLAKSHLLEHYWRYSDSPEAQTDAQRDIMMRHALTVLEYDTKVMRSSLTKGYRWILRFYFPFPAYVHILQDLHKRPSCNKAEKAWRVLSNNFEVRVNVPEARDGPFFDIFTKIVLSAWKQRESASNPKKGDTAIPDIVSIIREREIQKSAAAQTATTEQPDNISGMDLDEFPMAIPVGLGNIPCGLGGHYLHPGAGFGMQSQYEIDGGAGAIPLPGLDWTCGGPAAW
ncbi:hypothetical protein N7481_013297 [Penicillium waksmanii]|uniref:uncharacterized protein n=1 Tax=Penicillium waksmanii TaxID=69791 RepID=UPI002547C3DE|nr:uncharacterized protein N7481_013297 [Penicillium waksmanii]KAJ5966583.1 hypothetical protein N7481_013297 [Penicillium waksmanii]